MDLIWSTDSRYGEYETLLLRRDELRKEAESIWIRYVSTFGELMTAAYQEKLECVMRKKIIAYCQTAINRGGTVDVNAMQRYLDKEMAAYYANLKQLQEDNELCKNAKTISEYDLERAKKLYRRLVKLLHPDINPATDSQEILQELWQRVVTAYRLSDVEELTELEVLARKALRDLGDDQTVIQIPDLEERMEDLKEEIYDITHTEPYTYQTLLDDEKAVEEKKAELTAERERYRKYREELDAVIRRLMQQGGFTFQWQMN